MKMQGKMPPEHLQVAVWIGLTPQSAHLSTVRDCDHVKFDTTLSTWVPHTVNTSGKKSIFTENLEFLGFLGFEVVCIFSSNLQVVAK